MSIVFLNACNSPYSRETEILNKYLTEQFNAPIPESKHFFMVIQGATCSSCIEIVTDEFIKIQQQKFNLTLVTRQPNVIAAAVQSNNNVNNILIDTSPRLSRLNLKSGGATLFITENGRIIKKIEYGPDNVNEVKKDVLSN